jgi:hypothetical protein
MVANLKLTTDELLDLENALDMLRVYTLPGFPATREQRLASLSKLVTPKTLLTLSKIHLELGRLHEAQTVFAMARELEAAGEEDRGTGR